MRIEHPENCVCNGGSLVDALHDQLAPPPPRWKVAVSGWIIAALIVVGALEAAALFSDGWSWLSAIMIVVMAWLADLHLGLLVRRLRARRTYAQMMRQARAHDRAFDRSADSES